MKERIILQCHCRWVYISAPWESHNIKQAANDRKSSRFLIPEAHVQQMNYLCQPVPLRMAKEELILTKPDPNWKKTLHWPFNVCSILRHSLNTPATMYICIAMDEFQAYTAFSHLHDLNRCLLLHCWSRFFEEHVCWRSSAPPRRVIYWSNLSITPRIDKGLDKDTVLHACLYIRSVKASYQKKFKL